MDWACSALGRMRDRDIFLHDLMATAFQPLPNDSSRSGVPRGRPEIRSVAAAKTHVCRLCNFRKIARSQAQLRWRVGSPSSHKAAALRASLATPRGPQQLAQSGWTKGPTPFAARASWGILKGRGAPSPSRASLLSQSPFRGCCLRRSTDIYLKEFRVACVGY